MFFMPQLVSKSSDYDTSICQANRSHIERTLIRPLLISSFFSSVNVQNFIESGKTIAITH